MRIGYQTPCVCLLAWCRLVVLQQSHVGGVELYHDARNRLHIQSFYAAVNQILNAAGRNAEFSQRELLGQMQCQAL